jgi:hypothetical protein
MSKTIFLIGFLLYQQVCLSNNADTLKYPKKNTIYFSPFKLINNEIDLGYEYKCNKLSSLKMDASLIFMQNNNYPNYNNNNNEMAGTNIGIAFRKYIFYDQIINKKRSNNAWGVYISPYAAYQYIERNYNYTVFDGTKELVINEKNHQNAITPGMLTGMRFDLARGLISFDFNIGFGMKISTITGGNTYFNSSNASDHYYGRNGFIPNGNATIGFNF